MVNSLRCRHAAARRLGVYLAAALIAVAPWRGAVAGNWDFAFITSPEGVWVNEIVSILEGDSGTIWAATWGEGLHRIAFTAWDSFTESDGFVGDWQHVLARDQNGTVWVGTADGICRIQNGRQTAITTANTPSLVSHAARAMLVGENGDLLVGTNDGYILRCPAADLAAEHPDGWSVMAGPPLTGGNTIHDFIETAPGRYLASLKLSGTLEFDGDRWRALGGPDPNFSPVFGRWSGGDEIWAAHRYGPGPLLRWTPGGWETAGEVAAAVRCFAEGEDGALYIGTESGVMRRDGPAWTPLDLGPEIGAPDVQAIHVDANGAMWLGCREGLVRGSPRSWNPVREDELPRPVTAIIPGNSPGAPLYAMGPDHRTYRFDGEAWVAAATLSAEGAGTLVKATAHQDGAFWALNTRGDVLEYSLDGGAALRRIPRPREFGAAAEPYIGLYLAPSGRLFMHSDVGVHQLADGAWRHLPAPDPNGGWDHVGGLSEGAGGVIYMAANSGMLGWDGEAVFDLGARVGTIPGDVCMAVVAGRSGDVWFATHGSGVYRVSGREAAQLTRKDGLRSDAVSGLFEDAAGTLWAAYRRQGLGRFSAGHWFNLGFDHGLPNTAIAKVAETAPGTLWALAADGVLYRYRPDADPPVTRIVAAPARVDSHGIASFSFGGWDAWGHTPQRELRYSTRIVPGHAAPDTVPWSPFQEETTAVTPGLARGKYTFEVRAADEDGNVDPSPASVAFTVLAPPLQRPQFLLPISTGVLLGLALLLSRFRDYQRLRRSGEEIAAANRALLREIEERDCVERALRQSESHLGQAQTLARLGSWELDPQTQLGTWSREMFNLFHRAPAEGTPNFRDFLRAVHPDDRREFIRKHRELFLSGEPFGVEFRSNPAHGPLRYFYSRVHGLRDGAGHIRRFAGTTQDVTPQKEAELQRVELEEKLRQSQKLEAIGQLVGGIAHDFNNILHALLGFCHLARRVEPENRAGLAECLDGIEVAGNRAADLVRQLLTFSRREQLHRATLYLEPVLDETMKLLRSTLPAAIEIERIPGAPCFPVLADATQLHQIVLNLCTNAAQAMEKRGGTLRVGLENASPEGPTLLNTGELPPGDYAVLSVADTGPGIDPEIIDRIFDPFFTTKETGQGTGLGLTTVHGIVLAMGGGIGVESAPGAGTTVRVYLARSAEPPFPQRSAPKEPPAAKAPAPHLATRAAGRILLVDDEVNIAAITAEFLRRNGFEVDAFNHPAHALAAFESAPGDYAAVVTDFMMPEMTGVALASRVREISREIPLLLVSGRASENEVDLAAFAEVLQKPINLTTLMGAIERQLSRDPRSGAHFG